MKVLYLTSYVLGDSGANAADIFPRLAVLDATIDQVYVADFPKNKFHIETRQAARFLRLEWGRSWFRYAARIARKCKQDDINIIHVFYRQQNAVLLIFIRIWLILLRVDSTIIMDHRSVNLAQGFRSWRKKALNLLMQIFTHHLAGNLWAVETNHFFVFKPKHLIDLGYDSLPEVNQSITTNNNRNINVWFIGTLKPRNRKSDFLIDVFARVAEHQSKAATDPRIVIHVAGPTRQDQQDMLLKNPSVVYHGKVPRHELYKLLRDFPGIGLAYMNHEFHEYAPSLKFTEYAIMRFSILSSKTLGLQTQADRMNLPSPITFVKENAEDWTNAIIEATQNYSGLEPSWTDAKKWSYPAIFDRQVSTLYHSI
ncbi:MAG: hypothetical protein ABJL99_16945 [Aliishimia sp.]